MCYMERLYGYSILRNMLHDGIGTDLLNTRWCWQHFLHIFYTFSTHFLHIFYTFPFFKSNIRDGSSLDKCRRNITFSLK